MNENAADEGFSSRDTVVVVIDGPAVRTTEPLTPEVLAILKARKEKRDRDIAQFGDWTPNGPEQEGPKESS